MDKIWRYTYEVDYQKRQLNVYGDDRVEEWTWSECALKKTEKVIKAINQFHDEITKFWCEEGQRVLGHIAYSPPITAPKVTPRIGIRCMYSRTMPLSSINYPIDRLLPLQGIIEEVELHLSQMRELFLHVTKEWLHYRHDH